jgi:hypothetical protein
MPSYDRYREFIKRVSPTVLSSGWGEKLQGTIAGLLWDLIAQGSTDAARSPWLSLGLEQPTDALPVMADERGLFKYLNETDAQWQARLRDAWEIWDGAGGEVELLAQLTAAGYGAEVHSPVDWPARPPLNWPSQFWVLLTTAAPFGAPALAGAAVAGEHLCGVSGPIEHIAQIRNIVNTFRAGHVVCRQIIVRVSGTICGSGALVGDHLCGGVNAYISTGVPPS